MSTPNKKRKAKKDISPLEKLKRRGLTLPGYNYLGPFNSLDNGAPTNKSDVAAKKHDEAYTTLQSEGVNPYTTYNKADEDFEKEVGDDFGGQIGKYFFRGKRTLAQAGILKDATHSTIDQVPSNPAKKQKTGVLATTMGDNNGGSGLEPGLTETPIDRVDPHKIFRGPPSYTFASLPFNVDTTIGDTEMYARDIVFRMTSPYDPLAKMNTVDLNTNTGKTNVVTALADSLDDQIRPANWWNFYSGLYNYYHVISCRYHVFIENYGEPIWVYKMFYNDDIPNPSASNLDMQLWSDAEYHYLNTPFMGIDTNGTSRTIAYLPESTDNANMDDNDEDKNQTTNTVSQYQSSNHVQTRSGSTVLDLFGEYKPGQYTREIHLDGDVENWTLTNTNPKLPERMMIRIKPQNNAYSENDVATYGDRFKFRIRTQLSYLVEFKELKNGLRYPVQNQPITVTINNNPTLL